MGFPQFGTLPYEDHNHQNPDNQPTFRLTSSEAIWDIMISLKGLSLPVWSFLAEDFSWHMRVFEALRDEARGVQASWALLEGFCKYLASI